MESKGNRAAVINKIKVESYKLPEEASALNCRQVARKLGAGFRGSSIELAVPVAAPARGGVPAAPLQRTPAPAPAPSGTAATTADVLRGQEGRGIQLKPQLGRGHDAPDCDATLRAPFSVVW